MDMTERGRLCRYLQRQYENFTKREKEAYLEAVIKRLHSYNFEQEVIDNVISELLEEQDWPLEQLLAHLDMIDLDERT